MQMDGRGASDEHVFIEVKLASLFAREFVAFKLVFLFLEF